MEKEMKRIDDDMGLRSYLAQLNVITTFDSRPVVRKLGQTTEGRAMQVHSSCRRAGYFDPVSLSRELHRLIEGSYWRTTRGGHACMWEFPDEFNHVCLDGWKEVEEGMAMKG